MFAFVSPFTGLSATTVLIGLVAVLAGHPGAQLPRRAAGACPPTCGRRPAAWATARPGCSGRSSCRWPCRRSWPGCGSRPSPPSRWSPSASSSATAGSGQLITGGFNANFYRAEIVTGAVGCVLLALVADLLLAGVERLLTPWTRAGAVVNGFGEAIRLPQRPVQLDPPERHPRPARRAPGGSPRVAVLAAMRGRPPGRDAARAHRSRRRRRSSSLSNVSRAVPTLALLTIFAVTPDRLRQPGHDDRPGRLRHPADPRPTPTSGSAGSTRDVREAARAMGMSRGQVVAPGRAPAGPAADHDRHPDGGGAGRGDGDASPRWSAGEGSAAIINLGLRPAGLRR